MHNLLNSHRNIFFIFLLSLLLLFISCGGEDQGSEEKETSIPYIVCTTGMIGDVTANILGDEAQVKVLMGPGVDPHLYKATQGDLAELRKADVILYNGHHLEGKMGELFEKLSQTRTTIPVTEQIPEEKLNIVDSERGTVDPHLWFDVSLWIEVSRGIRDTLFQLYPDLKQSRGDTADAYLQELQKLDEWVESELNTIPEQQRILISAHDAYEYFGKRYDLQVKGLQGLSTVAQYSLKDVSDLVDFIIDNRIPAIFLESVVPERSMKAVIEGCEKRDYQLKLGGTLFADAMGEEGSPEGTYIGMVEYNVNLITDALTSLENKSE